MKHLLSLLISSLSIILLLSSCYIYSYVPVGNYALKTVNTPEGQDVSTVANTYSDDIVMIKAVMSSYNIEVQIANNSTSSIKVIWDEGAYIDESGNAHRIIHIGTKFVDKEKAQVPSIVPKGTQISDIVAPSDYVEYSNATSSWKYTSLASQGTSYSTEAGARASFSQFQPVKLLLPIEYEGSKREYTFTFVGSDYDVKTEQTYNAGLSLLAIFGIALGAPLIGALIGLAIANR